MKAKLSSRLALSLAAIASSCPAEKLDADSRYVIISDLRMGDGGKKDTLVRLKKAIVDILGGWYLPRGYTLVLDGDIEDLRRFWLKDIFSSWPELYAVFDAFGDAGRLRKILGERDLALSLLRSYPYKLAHGLKLDGAERSILVIHGHQASHPYVDLEYLKEYFVQWQCSAIRRRKEPEGDDDGRERFKTERRLYRAAGKLGIAIMEGHTRRPLFESRTSRESVRFEVERLLREGDPRHGEPKLDELIEVYKRAERHDRSTRSSGRPSGQAYDPAGPVSPYLFCPGRLAAAGEGRSREMRMMEIEGGSLRHVRWAQARGTATFERGGRAYLRRIARAASIEGVMDRIGLPVPEEDPGTSALEAPPEAAQPSGAARD